MRLPRTQQKAVLRAPRAQAPRPKRQRRTTDDLREQAMALRERGMVFAGIADALNVSDRRVKELLAA